MFPRVLCVLTVAAFCVQTALSPRAGAVPYSQIFAFGDSLSDIGNDFLITGGDLALPPPAAPTAPPPVPPRPTYYDGRFSDGPIWAETLAASLGLTLKPSQGPTNVTTDSISYAFGAAQSGVSNLTPGGFPVAGLRSQVDNTAFPAFNSFASDLAAAGTTANADALYAIWSGANDYLLQIDPSLGDLGLANLAALDPASVVANITAAISDLHALGARHFMILNLPDLGIVPLLQGFGALEAPFVATLNAKTAEHNALLSTALDMLEETLADIRLTLFDVNSLFATMLADAVAFGFTSTGLGPAAGCLFPPLLCEGVDSTGFFFHDEQHPTTAVHELIALAALAAIPVPAPATAPLFVAGLLGAAWLRRRARS